MADDGSADPVFRSNKRRKVFRKRPDDEVDGNETALSIKSPSSPAQSDRIINKVENEDDHRQEAEFGRHRRIAAARRGGIAFSTGRTQRAAPRGVANDDESQALVPITADVNVVDEAVGRFVAPTGLAVQRDDRHILADLRSAGADSQTNDGEDIDDLEEDDDDDNILASHDRKIAPRTNPGHAYGALEEVEIGTPSTTSKQPGPRVKKQRVRLNRFGKPLPPRKPRYNARTDTDIARDAMVEDLLRESRLDNIYSDPADASGANTQGVAPGQDEAADERLAEEFQREFLANLAERQAKKPPGPPGNAGAAGGAEAKGPKLGGSRSQRAAMRAIEEREKAGKGGSKK